MGKGNYPSIGKEGWISMGRRQTVIHERKSLCAQSQGTSRGNPKRTS